MVIGGGYNCRINNRHNVRKVALIAQKREFCDRVALFNNRISVSNGIESYVLKQTINSGVRWWVVRYSFGKT